MLDNRIIDGSSWGGGYGGVCNNYLSREIMIELFCIQTHSQKAVVAGNVYPFISDKCPCSCECFDVGIKGTGRTKSGNALALTDLCRCSTCGVIYPYDGIWWIRKGLFAQMGERDEHETYSLTEKLIEV